MQENTQKITKEFCQGKVLLFYPRTAEESVFIQRKVFEMGYKWADNTVEITLVEKSLLTGMALDRAGRLWVSPNTEHRTTGWLCTSNQFNEDYLSPDQTFILEQFNKLAARLDRLETKIDAIYDELRPQMIQKPILLPEEKFRP